MGEDFKLRGPVNSMVQAAWDTSNLKLLERDGKALTICCVVCESCGQYTITFSGIQICEGAEWAWPSDLNTTFIVPYSHDVGDAHFFVLYENGWKIILSCNLSSCLMELYAISYEEYEAFGYIGDIVDACGNGYQLSSCGHSLVIGYDGIATLSWDSTGC